MPLPVEPTDPDREWDKSVFFQASELPPEERQAFLDRACVDKPERRPGIEKLLKYADVATQPTRPPMKAMAAGQVIGGRFVLVSKLGEGGMGQVYEARDTQLAIDDRTEAGARVALKLIRPELSGRPGVESHFRQELILSRQIAHKNVCKMYDLGVHREADGSETLFLSMEYLAGQTLAARLKDGRLERAEIYDLAKQLFAGLSEVHRTGIVHRDLKPSNLHLVPDAAGKARLVVTDFGLARSLTPQGEPTTTQMRGGTPGYTAPEQFETGECTVPADIYSLGVILLEMVTGEPFNPVNAKAQLLRAAPEWSTAILPCLERDPTKRPQNVRTVEKAFAPPRRWPHLQLPSWTHWAAVAALLAGTAVWVAWPTGKETGNAEITKVTFDPGLTMDPTVSFDGRRMAFSSDRALDGVSSIWRHPMPDGPDARLTQADAHASTPAISPDGTQVAYRSEREGGGVYVVDWDGGLERLVGPKGRHPMFSPDGQRIVYWTGQEGDYSTPSGQIWLVDLQGGAARRLHEHFADARFPAWSTSGDRILFRGSRDNSVKWEDATDWWVSDLESEPVAVGAYRVLRSAGLTVHDSRVFWGADQILFGGRSGHSTNLWSLPVAGKAARISGPLRPLTTGSETEVAPWLMPDGGIAYSHKRAIGHVLKIPLRGGVSGGPAEQVSHDEALDTRPSISFDGRRLLFTRRLGEVRNVLLREMRTGEQRSMLRDQPAIPFLSPDGTRVAYTMPLGRLNPIFLLDVDGGVPRQICEDCGEAAGWTPDGQSLLYLTGAEGASRSLGVLNVDTRLRRILLAPVSGLAEVSLSSRDVLAFTLRSGGTTSKIHVAPVPASGTIASSSWTAVPGTGNWSDEPRWSIDGRTLYLLSELDNFVCLWRMAMGVSGRRPEPPVPFYHNHVGRLNLHHLSRPAQGVGVAKDSVVLNVPSISGNIWLIRTRELKKTY